MEENNNTETEFPLYLQENEIFFKLSFRNEEQKLEQQLSDVKHFNEPFIVTNRTNELLLIRIRTNKKKEYAIGPAYFHLDEDKSFSVRFILLMKTLKAKEISKHKFKMDVIKGYDKTKYYKEFQSLEYKSKEKNELLKKNVTGFTQKEQDYIKKIFDENDTSKTYLLYEKVLPVKTEIINDTEKFDVVNEVIEENNTTTEMEIKKEIKVVEQEDIDNYLNNANKVGKARVAINKPEVNMAIINQVGQKKRGDPRDKKYKSINFPKAKQGNSGNDIRHSVMPVKRKETNSSIDSLELQEIKKEVHENEESDIKEKNQQNKQNSIIQTKERELNKLKLEIIDMENQIEIYKKNILILKNSQISLVNMNENKSKINDNIDDESLSSTLSLMIIVLCFVIGYMCKLLI